MITNLDVRLMKIGALSNVLQTLRGNQLDENQVEDIETCSNKKLNH